MNNQKHTITLTHPVAFEGETITTLQMKPPIVKYIITAQSLGATDAEREVHIMAALTEQPSDMIEQLHMADYMKLQGQYQDFLASSPAT